ncbi:hypothetical protein [Spirosoma agri]|uniref:DUF481 domain-containing protein n=1 Tax=Spirosoma agri TaxID=1987381 RepID=A0A6M0IJW5_9BACT|nr:hypothetical protein [Spirosoma agri]NEU67671.1 hypothetical protein [Spirosoma agri]
MKTVLLLLTLFPAICWAQRVKITAEDMARKQSFLLLRDGSVVRGQLIRQDSLLITVRKAGGDLTFIESDQLIGVMPIRPRPVNQTPTTALYSVFVFKDSSRIEGRFVRKDSTMITVRKRNGQLTYFEPELLDHVDSVRIGTRLPIDSARLFKNRFSPWLLVGQTAYNPEKGRFYYRNTWLLVNEFQYGITRFWSVGASFVAPLPWLGYSGIESIRNPVLNRMRLTSKLSAPIGQALRAGLNVTYQPSTNRDFYRPGVWTFQALASIGNSQRNVTIGYGLVNRGSQRVYEYWSSAYPTPFTDQRVPDQSFMTVGVVQKVLPGLTLLSDNRINLGKNYYGYDDNGERATVSFAFRLDRRRHAFDLGVYGFLYRNNYYWDGKMVRFYPYIGYNLIFGSK